MTTPIPSIRIDGNVELQRILDELTSAVNLLNGAGVGSSANERAITRQDVIDAGYPGIGDPGPGDGELPPEIVYPPEGPANAPYDLEVVHVWASLKLSWGANFTNVAFFEIWRHTADDRNEAELLTQVIGNKYLDPVGWNQTYYYWVRAVGTDGNPTAFNAVSGTIGVTPQSTTEILDQLQEAISESELVQNLQDRLDDIDDLADPNSIKSRLGVTETDIANAESDITTLQSDVTNAEGDIATAQSDIIALQSADSSIAARVDTLEAQSGSYSAAYEYLFDSDAESWTGSNAAEPGNDPAWQTGGTLELTPDVVGTRAHMRSPDWSSSPVSGSLNRAVIVRMRLQTLGDASDINWEGRIQYDNGTHSYSGSYEKTLSEEDIWGTGEGWADHVGEWVVVTWDMSELDGDATDQADWINSDIDQLQILIADDPDDGAALPVWEFDWIQIANFSYDSLSTAIDALAVRVTDNEGDISTNATNITSLQSSLTDAEADISTNATAITTLETDVTAVEGDVTAQATEITQLQVQTGTGSGGTGGANMVNPLTSTGVPIETGWNESDSTFISVASRLIGGETSVCGGFTITAPDTSGWIVSDPVPFDNDEIYKIDVEFCVPDDVGKIMIEGLVKNGSGTNVATTSLEVDPVANSIDGVTTGDTSNLTPEMCQIDFNDAPNGNVWWRYSGYVLGRRIDQETCPRGRLNNTDLTDVRGYGLDGYIELRDGFRPNPTTGDTFELRVRLNDGDGTTTNVYVRKLSVKPVGGLALNNTRINLQQEATVRLNDIGDLEAQWTVKIDGDGRVIGFWSRFRITRRSGQYLRYPSRQICSGKSRQLYSDSIRGRYGYQPDWY